MKKIFSFFIFISYFMIFGQDNNFNLNLPKIVPASPSASAFKKYINYPVSKFTGLPNVNQNIYTITQDGVSIGVNLKYHASGLRVKDPGGSVGLGWDLLVGGVINREIRGKRDEQDMVGYLTIGSNGQHISEEISRFSNIHYSTASQNDKDFYEWFVQMVIDNNIDTEPDIFTFNILGQSGRFVFNQLGIPVMLGDDNYEILGTITGGFTIIDKIGNKYIFNISDTDRSSIITHISGGGIDDEDYNDNYISAYKLSKIITIKGNEINFRYKNILRSIPSHLTQNLQVDYYDDGQVNYNIVGSETYTDINEKLITSIEFKEGVLNFYYDPTIEFLLKEIELRNRNNQLVFKKELNYCQYDINQIGTGESRILLKEINQEKDGEVLPLVSFNYYEGSFPSFDSKAIDDWGFYNGKAENQSLISRSHSIINSDYSSTGLLNYFNSWSGDRNPVLTTTKIGMLKDIIYPTKGKTTIEYELNQSHLNGILGGLRVKNISQYDALGFKILQKNYQYSTIGLGTIPFGKFGKVTYHEYFLYADDSNSIPSYTQYSISSDPRISLNTTFGNSTVYNSVTEEVLNGSEMQKIETNYNISRDIINLIGTTSILNTYRNGLILKEKIVNTDNNSVKEITNQYDYVGNQFANTIVGVVLDIDHFLGAYDGSERPNPDPTLMNVQIYHYNQNNIARKIKATTYFNQEDIINMTSYYYFNNSSLLIGKMFNNSVKNIYESYFYPKDYGLISGLPSSAQNALNYMLLNNINIPILTETTTNNSFSFKKRVDYKLFNRYPLPEKILTTKEGGQTDPRIIYHHYDQYGNPIELSKADGPHIYYMYGYQHTKPVAKIVNFTRAQAQSLQAVINEASNLSDLDDDNMSVHSQGNEYALYQKLKQIQNTLHDAQMTFYTYDPLIGVTSITDPKGDTQYYIYDSMNRLQYIKDKDGHILKEYKYHYRITPQPIVSDGIDISNHSISNHTVTFSVTTSPSSGSGGGLTYEWSVLSGGTAVGTNTSDHFDVQYACSSNVQVNVQCTIRDVNFPDNNLTLSKQFIWNNCLSGGNLQVVSQNMDQLIFHISNLTGGNGNLTFKWYYDDLSDNAGYVLLGTTSLPDYSVSLPVNLCGKNIKAKCIITDNISGQQLNITNGIVYNFSCDVPPDPHPGHPH